MKLNVFKSERGFVLAEPGDVSAGLARLRHGAAPESIGWVQSIHLPAAASIEILDAVNRNTVALLPFARARELGLEGLIQGAGTPSTIRSLGAKYSPTLQGPRPQGE